jgi:anti-sigma regulatory factor (Ser/Thr protein kinase)
MSVLPETAADAAGEYSHEAFLYAGAAEFVAGAMSFIGPALAAGDPVLALLSGPKIGMLRRELGGAAGRVSFADVDDVGGNPARIIGVWWRFAQAHAGAARLHGIGEALSPDRSAAEIGECELYEALLNVAFDAATPLRLVCPYDLATLTADVVEEAQRNHPFLTSGPGRESCTSFQPINPAAPYARPLPDRPADVACLPFQRGGLGHLRAYVAGWARGAGLGERSAASLVAAVNEVATNSLLHGGGRGELRVWTDGGSLLCEVCDHGHLTQPMAGRLPPAEDGGAGLWLANQLTDLVQIHSAAGRTAIRIHQRL